MFRLLASIPWRLNSGDRLKYYYIVGGLILLGLARFVPGMIFLILLIPLTYFIIDRIFRKSFMKAEALTRRKEALRHVQKYLAPYSDVWKNLTVSNDYCSLKLGRDGETIVGIEKPSEESDSYRMFRVVKCYTFEYPELWNLFCSNYNGEKTYDCLLDDCRLYALVIQEELINKCR